jgi:hypothetical protein
MLHGSKYVSSTGRQWTVLLDVNCDGKVAARISVGGEALVPVMQDGTPERALHYVERALLDMKPGDMIAGAVACPITTTRRYCVASLAVFKLWLADVLHGVLRILKLAAGVEGRLRSL